MSTFQDCIVSLLDLNDFRKVLTKNSKRAVRTMRMFHKLVDERASAMSAHDEVCFWQDSVLLLASVNSSQRSYERVMNDVSMLKKAIDSIHPDFCHAVCVKGQSFPDPRQDTDNAKPRIIYLSASSLAFANCFDIERHLKYRKADWYIDSRITAKIKTRLVDYTHKINLLPRNTKRDIHVFRGSFRAEP
jgi:hypothetical protein